MHLAVLPLTHGWSFKQKQDDCQADEWLPVIKVPTQIHLDLLANHRICDPFQDLNEKALQWIGEEAWVYRTSFPAPDSSASRPDIISDLVFEGLDTFATVRLNGHQILTADNMFVRYRVNVSDHIRHGSENHLEIEFDSALLRGRQLVEQHAHEHKFFVRQTEPGRVPVRKAQYNWGWDWGPILMTAGPWKPVYLEQYDARIDDLWTQSHVSQDLKTCTGSVFVNVSGNWSADDRIHVTLSSLQHPCTKVIQTVARVDDQGHCELSFQIDRPELWYPLGYGKQARYSLSCQLVRPDEGLLDSKQKSLGFRRSELVQEVDPDGKSFYFRINGIDVFAGGSCWVPCDSYQALISEQRYRDWIRLMVEGNQVMVRVWGGGVYEHDALLDACDEMGVLVWHDFQMACANYPVYRSFLDSLEVEARQQVRRLRTHPAVVIWAGNNEDYQVQERYGLDYDYGNDKDPQSWLKSSFPARYIYEYLLPKIVEEEHPGMIYHPSSPWGDGKPTADATVGDIHQWNIWHGLMCKYQQASSLGGRFVSEFGMEAYPHLSTIHRMTTDPSQLYPGSMVLDAHNKAIDHERRLMTYVAENFRPRHDLASYAHLTQVVQAEAMRAAYKAWRRDWGQPRSRKCGGVLVWQLNDCWPTMSWAVVDYHLVKKPAFYAIKRALRQVDVGVARTHHDWTATAHLVDEQSNLRTGQVDQTERARKGKFDVWIANGSLAPLAAAITTRFISVRTGQDVCAAIETSVTAAPNATTLVLQHESCPPAIPCAGDPTRPFPLGQYDPYVIHSTLSVDGAVVSSDAAWPEPIKYLDMADRGVALEVSPDLHQVTVTARRPVKGFVFEEVGGLQLSDNGFDILPGERHVVLVQGSLTADQLKWTYIGCA